MFFAGEGEVQCLCETWLYPPACCVELQDPRLMAVLIPPFLLIPLLAAQTVFGSALPLLPGLILEPSGWAAGWLCHCDSEVTARGSGRF